MSRISGSTSRKKVRQTILGHSHGFYSGQHRCELVTDLTGENDEFLINPSSGQSTCLTWQSESSIVTEPQYTCIYVALFPR